MKIEISCDKIKIPLKNVDGGQCFWHNNMLYMKTIANYDQNAVCLITGQATTICVDFLVRPEMKAKVVV